MPLGWPELLVILTIIVIVFGAGKLPEVGSAVGKGIREFRHESGEDDGDTEAENGHSNESKDRLSRS